MQLSSHTHTHTHGCLPPPEGPRCRTSPPGGRSKLCSLLHLHHLSLLFLSVYRQLVLFFPVFLRLFLFRFICSGLFPGLLFSLSFLWICTPVFISCPSAFLSIYLHLFFPAVLLFRFISMHHFFHSLSLSLFISNVSFLSFCPTFYYACIHLFISPSSLPPSPLYLPPAHQGTPVSDPAYPPVCSPLVSLRGSPPHR